LQLSELILPLRAQLVSRRRQALGILLFENQIHIGRTESESLSRPQ